MPRLLIVLCCTSRVAGWLCFSQTRPPRGGGLTFCKGCPHALSKEKGSLNKKSTPAWHKAFMSMMPAIKAQAKFAFRKLNAEAREEAVQAVICNACFAYSRLVELKKTELAFPGTLAKYAVAQVCSGRNVGGNLNACDVSSQYCRKRKRLILERLDKFDKEQEAWEEALVESKRAGPAETAVIRLDFSAWLQLLPRRLRKIATFLANGEGTKATAKKFHLSEGRISQMRKELYQAWYRFQGDMSALAAA